jgi:transposase-like protein
MTSRKEPYRRHSPEFKLLLCQQLRAGEMRRTDAQQKYKLSAALIQEWLRQFDQGTMDADAILATPGKIVVAEYEAKIADLERKVGQLTMELDLVKKIQRPRLVVNNESSSIISGPQAAPSAGDAK